MTFLINNKKGFEMSFAWIFAIIAGVVIIFLAIYFSAKFINTQQTTTGTVTSKEIGILLDPLETSFDTAQTTSFSLAVESRIYNQCDEFGNFGTQGIQISQQNFNKWVKTNVDVSFENKYIFSGNETEGKTFYVFSKSFDFPFRVADLIYITSSSADYCFQNAPSNVEDELANLNQSNIMVSNCSSDSIKVCFNSGYGCDINVNYGDNSVTKNGYSVNFYSDALMYAAVFSDKDVYECQLKRLMERTSELYSLYQGKISIISAAGCPSNIQNDLIQLKDYADGFSSSGDIVTIGAFSDQLNQENSDSQCMLW